MDYVIATLTPEEANVLKWILTEEIEISLQYCNDMYVDYDALCDKLAEMSDGATNN